MSIDPTRIRLETRLEELKTTPNLPLDEWDEEPIPAPKEDVQAYQSFFDRKNLIIKG